MANAYVFEAELLDAPGVGCRLALRGSHTLEELHGLLRRAFAWHDDHLYSFWLDGEFWGDREREYTAPFDFEESDAKSAATPLDRLGLEVGQRIAYVFDFGDEWRVLLTVADPKLAEGETLPGIVESRGKPPPQYLPVDDEEIGTGD